MKRPSEEERGRSSAKVRRQQPSSCESCRKRKLKCDRASPCSNCTTRGLSCVFAAKPTVTTQTSLASSYHQAQSGTQVSTTPPNLDSSAWDPWTPSSHLRDDRPRNDYPVYETAISTSPALHDTPHQSAGPLKSYADHDTNDLSVTALRLEAAATGLVESPNEAMHNSTPSEYPSCDIMFPVGMRTLAISLDIADVRAIMPTRAKAQRLLDHYADTMHWACAISHTPTLRRHLKDTFEQLETRVPDLHVLGLISGILGISAYGWSPALTGFSRAESLSLSKRLIDLAQRALLAGDYINKPSLEAIQAVMLMEYVLMPETGGLGSILLTLRALTHLAQSLGLHRVDSRQSQRQRQHGPVDHVRLELQRRAWWMLTASDWLMSTMSGPHSSTYAIHSDQMQVQYPSNVDDEALDADGVYDRPRSIPTQMSVAIARFDLAVLWKSVIDLANQRGVDVHELDYETVQTLDAKFNQYQDRLPFFLKGDEENRRRSRAIDTERPYIAWARGFLQCGYFIRVLHIHRRWLASGAEDERYSKSRAICLSAARTIIRVEREIYESWGYVSNWSRQWAVVHHLLVASLLIAMEYSRGNASMRSEVLEACQALERSQGSSIARIGLKQLQDILGHWASRGNNQQAREDTVHPTANAPGLTMPDLDLSEVFGSNDPFTDMWSDMMAMPSALDQSEWDQLFQDLNQG